MEKNLILKILKDSFSKKKIEKKTLSGNDEEKKRGKLSKIYLYLYSLDVFRSFLFLLVLLDYH